MTTPEQHDPGQPLTSPEPHNYQPMPEDEIDLRELLKTLWKQRRIVIAFVLVGCLLGIGGSIRSIRYVSDALFLVTAPIDQYKRYETALFSGPRLKKFLEIGEHQGEAAAVLTKSLIAHPEKFSTWLTPEFSFTDKDARAYGVKSQETGTLVGIRLVQSGRQSDSGSAIALLGEYIRDTVIRADMDDILAEQCNSYGEQTLLLRNAQLQDNFAMEQEETRAQMLREIIANQPTDGGSINTQNMWIEPGDENNNARYLPLETQLIAAKISLAELELNTTRREQEQTANNLKRGYYCEARNNLDEQSTSVQFILNLENLQLAQFQDHDLAIDIVEQTWNQLDIEHRDWTNTYLQKMRFVTTPAESEVRKRSLSLMTGGVLGGLLGGMLGMFSALILVWWRNEPTQPDQ